MSDGNQTSVPGSLVDFEELPDAPRRHLHLQWAHHLLRGAEVHALDAGEAAGGRQPVLGLLAAQHKERRLCARQTGTLAASS